MIAATKDKQKQLTRAAKRLHNLRKMHSPCKKPILTPGEWQELAFARHGHFSPAHAYIPGRSHNTKIDLYFFDHSEVQPNLSFRLNWSKSPRNIDVGGPGRFRSGYINASKNKNLQLSHAIMRVGTARRASFHSIRSRTNNSTAAIDIIWKLSADCVCVTMLSHFKK